MTDTEKIEIARETMERYRSSKRYIRTLQQRIDECRDDINNPPISSVGGGIQSGISEGCASLIFREAGLIEKLTQAEEELNPFFDSVESAVARMPYAEPRTAIEMVYLGGQSVKESVLMMHISHSRFYDYINDGLLSVYELKKLNYRTLSDNLKLETRQTRNYD